MDNKNSKVVNMGKYLKSLLESTKPTVELSSSDIADTISGNGISIKFMIKRGEKLLEEGKYEESLKILKQLLIIEPGNMEVLLLIKGCNELLGENSESIKIARRIEKEDSRSLIIQEAFNFRILGKYKEALNEIAKLPEKTLGITALEVKAQCEYELGKYDESIITAGKFINPGKKDLYTNEELHIILKGINHMVNSLLELNKVEDALRLCDEYWEHYGVSLYIIKGKILFHMGVYSGSNKKLIEALNYIEQGLLYNEKDVEGLLLKIDIKSRIGLISEAEEDAAESYFIYTNEGEIPETALYFTERLGELYGRICNYTEALNIYTTGIERGKECGKRNDLWLGVAESKYNLGEFSECINICEKILSTSQNYKIKFKANLCLIKSLYKKGEINNAHNLLKKELKDKKGNIELMIIQTNFFLAENQLRKAKNNLAILLKKYGNILEVMKLETEIYLAQGMTKEAENNYDIIITECPYDIPSLLNLAEISKEIGDLDMANEYTDRVLDISPNHIEAIILKSTILIELNNLEKALVLLYEGLNLSPDNRKLLKYLGVAYYKIGDHPNALLNFEKASEETRKIGISDIELESYLGTLYMKTDSKKSLQIYNNLLKENPENFIFKCKKLNALNNSGLLAECLKFGLTLYKDTPHPDIANTILNCLLKSQKYEQVFEEGKKLLEDFPEDDRLWNNIGIAYAKQGRFEEAYDHFENAYRINPHNTDSLKNISLVAPHINTPRFSFSG